MRQSRGVNKVASWIAGYDVFISYRHTEAHNYAKALEQVLESKGLMVFRDESEEDAGVPLEIFIKRACAARALVVLATPTVFESSNVHAELSSYLSQRINKWYRRPFSRIISINVDQALSNAPSEPREWRRLSDFVYEPETLEAIGNAIPSKEVIERLSRASIFMRSWRLFISAMAALLIAVLLSIGGASLYLNSVVHALSLNKAELLSAQKESAGLKSSNQLLNDQNEGLKSSISSLQGESRKLTDSNTLLTGQNIDLRNQTSQLQQETNQLTLQSTMLQTRIAAQTRLAEDPILAYRLAEEAYKLKPDHDNRKLILSALSKIDLFYGFQTEGYSIEDLKEPFVLLSGRPKGSEEKEFLVFKMNTLAIQAAKITASHAWIVPIGETWRLLTLNFNGSGADAIPVYQLKDGDGRTLGETIQGRGLSGPKFINNGKVSIDLYKDPRLLVWDLVNDSKQFVLRDTNSNEGTYFYQIYGALDTRSDGVSAGHYDNGLVLIDKDGKIKMESYTPVEFDPSSFFSAAKWSPDDQYLALNYFDRKRLGIWNPLKKSFVWLDPDKWIVDSYAWSLNGHLLAFSGRTENDIDVTVEVVDASSAELSRKIIYKGNVPVAGMAFLPGDEQLAVGDRDGSILIIQISTGQVLETAYQKGVRRLFSTQNAFYSSSPDLFRVWSTKPAPSKHWLFESSKNRVYRAVGAADPSWNWLAVPFVDNKKTGGIELRKIVSGERRDLDVPDTESMSVQFSENGKWLVLETLSTLRIYDASSWAYHDFKLLQGDGQFFSLRIVADTLYAHVLGRDWMSNTSNEYDYIITLNGNQPTLTGRVHSKDKKDKPDGSLLLKQIEGWEFGNLYKYQSAGISSSPDSGWAYYVKCRDQPLGARDCDIQFLPMNLQRIMSLYDSLLWKPTDAELKAWVR